jgi:hypothetical protein
MQNSVHQSGRHVLQVPGLSAYLPQSPTSGNLFASYLIGEPPFQLNAAGTPAGK